jgi:argininosuccinate synthase
MSDRRILLSFSGGLCASHAAFLLSRQGHAVDTVTFDCGGLDAAAHSRIEARSADCGARRHRRVDLRAEFCDRALVPLIRSGQSGDGIDPPSLAAERGLQAATLARLANKGGYSAVAHGGTAEGSDGMRFERTLRELLRPGVDVLAPLGDAGSDRAALATPLRDAGISVEERTITYSRSESLWGTVVSGGPLDHPHRRIPMDLREAVLPASKVERADEDLGIGFTAGIPTSLGGRDLALVELVEELSTVAAAHGLGREVCTGDTPGGLRRRVVIEAPAAEVIRRAHRELMRACLSGWQLHLRERFLPAFGRLLHEGRWLDPAMADVDAYLSSEQQTVNGNVTLRLGRGTLDLIAVESPDDRLLEPELTDPWAGAGGGYDPTGLAEILGVEPEGDP